MLSIDMTREDKIDITIKIIFGIMCLIALWVFYYNIFKVIVTI